MLKYECIKPLVLKKYDDEGASIDGETITIEANTGWYVDDESTYNLIASAAAVRLIQISINDNHGRWIEIHEDTLCENFVKID